jgi:hypothetical protein
MRKTTIAASTVWGGLIDAGAVVGIGERRRRLNTSG